MKANLVLDSKKSKKRKSDFVVSLKGIEFIDEVDLSSFELIDRCMDSIKKKNFSYASELLKLVVRLSSYGDEKVEKLKCIYRAERLLDCYNNGIKSVKGIVDFIKEQKNFMRYVKYELKVDFDDEVQKLIERVNDISIKEEEIIKLCEKARLCDLVAIKKSDIASDDNKFSNILNIVLEKMDAELRKISDINQMILFLESEYSREFLESDIFKKNIRINYENCDILLDEINKIYLVYRFVNGISVEERVEILYNKYNSEYLKLSRIEKCYLVSEMIKKEYEDVRLFDEEFMKGIKNVKENRSSRSIYL